MPMHDICERYWANRWGSCAGTVRMPARLERFDFFDRKNFVRNHEFSKISDFLSKSRREFWDRNFWFFARFFLLELRFFPTHFGRPYLHGRVEPDVHFWCVETSTIGIFRLLSVNEVLASIEHSKLSKSMILCCWCCGRMLVSVDGVLASIEHSKLSQSMILCFKRFRLGTTLHP